MTDLNKENVSVIVGRKGAGMDLFAVVLSYKMRRYFKNRCIGWGAPVMKAGAL